MKNITIPEIEYLQMKQTIHSLQQQLVLLKDEDFLAKLNTAYQLFNSSTKKSRANHSDQPVSLKRGSAKKLITYISEDFNAPLDDFKEYM